MGEPAGWHDEETSDAPSAASGSVSASLRDERLWRKVAKLRRLQAEIAGDVLREMQSGSFTDDGHATAKAWIAAVLNCSNDEAIDWVRLAKAQRDMPATAAAFADGALGVCQVREIARVFRNPRCRERIAD